MKKLIFKLATWLVQWATPKDKREIIEVVREAFVEVGLPGEQFTGEYDLLKSGKLANVLVRVAAKLDSDQNFRTVNDVVAVFSRE